MRANGCVYGCVSLWCAKLLCFSVHELISIVEIISGEFQIHFHVTTVVTVVVHFAMHDKLNNLVRRGWMTE